MLIQSRMQENISSYKNITYKRMVKIRLFISFHFSLCRSAMRILRQVNWFYGFWPRLLNRGRLCWPVRTNFFDFIWFNFKLQHARYTNKLLHEKAWILPSDLCRQANSWHCEMQSSILANCNTNLTRINRPFNSNSLIYVKTT